MSEIYIAKHTKFSQNKVKRELELKFQSVNSN